VIFNNTLAGRVSFIGQTKFNTDGLTNLLEPETQENKLEYQKEKKRNAPA